MGKNYFTQYLLLSLLLASCNPLPPDVQSALDKAGGKRPVLETVIAHYNQPKDSLKRQAAYFLIADIDEHYFYAGKLIETYDDIIHNSKRVNIPVLLRALDSLQRQYSQGLHQEQDVEVISAQYLIENIDLAFEAWQKPWAKHLTFEQFCEYILPYKSGQEKPENWRAGLVKRYSWVGDSVSDKSNPKEVCTLINKDLQSWFTIISGFDYPADIPYSVYFKVKSARDCADAAKMTLYPMRAMGIPVAYDFTPHWANRSQGHAWNAVLYKNGKTVNFMGSEAHPGMHKLEFVGFDRMKWKKAKVYRQTFSKQSNSLAVKNNGQHSLPAFFYDSHFKDVTSEYLPVSDVQVAFNGDILRARYAYLCVFDNRNWNAIHWGEVKRNGVVFTDMGRAIAYLPAFYKEERYVPATYPLILTQEGSVRVLAPNKNKTQSLKLERKYPEDNSNKVVAGDTYEVFYWESGWQSLGKQKAVTNHLTYRNAPTNALFWIRNLDQGKQERIFTYEQGKQVWW